MFTGVKYNPKGKLVIIGGHEDKSPSGKRAILKEVAAHVRGGKLVVTTLASKLSQELWREYKKVFTALGVKNVVHLSLDSREQAFQKRALKILKGAKGIFFTGGDQLVITSEIGGTDLCQMIHKMYYDGGIIAGTSAGASVMGTEMLVIGAGDKTTESFESVNLAPGLNFVKETIIDQHFAERGRISRLLAAVALNPRHLGIGIDENTAIVFTKSSRFEVIGKGGVYIVDCSDSTHSNVAERSAQKILSVHNAQVHLLSEGGMFDMVERQPVLERGRKIKRTIENQLSYQ